MRGKGRKVAPQHIRCLCTEFRNTEQVTGLSPKEETPSSETCHSHRNIYLPWKECLHDGVSSMGSGTFPTSSHPSAPLRSILGTGWDTEGGCLTTQTCPLVLGGSPDLPCMHKHTCTQLHVSHILATNTAPLIAKVLQ